MNWLLGVAGALLALEILASLLELGFGLFRRTAVEDD